jgi:peptide/nickel transport system substrate-binding protein
MRQISISRLGARREGRAAEVIESLSKPFAPEVNMSGDTERGIHALDSDVAEISDVGERMLDRRHLLERGLALGVSLPFLAQITGSGSALAAVRQIDHRGATATQLVFVDGADAVTLDPHASPDASYTFNLCRGPAEALVDYQVTSKGVAAAPRLAKSWKHNANATVWDFTLRAGVKFQDGTAFNAHTAKANFDRILALNLVPAGRLGAVKSVSAVNDHVLRFTLPAPNAAFIYPLALMLMISPTAWNAHIQNDDYGQAWAANNIVGTGPYQIVNRVKGSSTMMQKWNGYWGGWKGHHVRSVVVDVAGDPATRALMLQNGEADVANGIATANLKALRADPNILVHYVQAPGAQFAGCRFSGPLADVNVRRAMMWAFDSAGFIKSSLQGAGSVARGHLYTDFPYFDKSMPVIKQNMAKAKQYLAQSDHKNGFSATFLVLPAYVPYQADMASVWQANLKQLNIDLKIRAMASVAAFYASIQDPNGADLWAWTGAAQTPDYIFQARRQWGTGYEYPRGVNGGYSNPTFDSLMNAIASTDDPKKLKADWSKVQKILLNDVPFIPLFIPTNWQVKRKGWKGMPQNPFDLVPNYYHAYEQA